jgi:hypothetical protein
VEAAKRDAIRLALITTSPNRRSEVGFDHPIIKAYLAAEALANGRWKNLLDGVPTADGLSAVRLFGAGLADRRTAEEICRRLEELGDAERRLGRRLTLFATGLQIAAGAGLDDELETLLGCVAASWSGAPAPSKIDAIDALAATGTTAGHGQLLELAVDEEYTVSWYALEALAASGSGTFETVTTLAAELILEGQAIVEFSEAHEEYFERMKPVAKFLPAWIEGLKDDECAAGVALLEQFVHLVVRMARDGRGLGVEASIVQGFKHAAVRPGLEEVDDAIEQMLRAGQFFYSRLIAFQALARRGAALAADGQDDRAGRIRRTIAEARRREDHPFALEAGRLALRAIEYADADRFVWHDESVALQRSGCALDPDTSRLLADLALELNMNEQLIDPTRLRKTRVKVGSSHELPHCLSLDRTRARLAGADLDPCHAACGFHLCPYLHRGKLDRAHRGHPSPAFCRRQEELARRDGPPRWQPRISKADLADFWRHMGEGATD